MQGFCRSFSTTVTLSISALVSTIALMPVSAGVPEKGGEKDAPASDQAND
jgi:hypothetical protein